MKDSKKFILNVSSTLDIKKINKNTKYINIDISNYNKDVIDYFKVNGKDYMYAETINNTSGYIYVDYDTFYKSELIIDNIIKNIDSNYSDIEKVKYLYISLGNMLGYDININPLKNECFSFSRFSIINNIWGSILTNKTTNISVVKLLYYLCSIIGISCDIINTNDSNYLKNKIFIDNNYLIVDLMKDLPFIQSKFKTRYFASFNDDIELDKKIKYINDSYTEKKLDKVLKKINYDDSNFLNKVLINIQNIININNIKQYELSIILNIIFDKYYTNYDITINNLYINNINRKDHFILISYNDEHYSFNYSNNSFMLVTDNNLLENIDNNKIGVYLNEHIPLTNMNKKEVI